MQKLITEVRRFRSDQGLADRQKVPARLSDIDAADLDAPDARGDRRWRGSPTPADGFSPSASVEVRLSGGTVVVELDTSGTVDVAAERRRLEKDLAAAQKELAGTIGQARQRGVPGQGARRRRRQDPRAGGSWPREEVERITATAGRPLT